MTLIEATILGVIQGLTEFLPISSSGHLVIGQALLEIEQPGNEFEILVHLGTLASVMVVFFDDIKSLVLSLESKKTQIFILFILIGTLPAIGIGLGFKDLLKSLFDDISAVGFALLFTGLILYGSSFIKKGNKEYTYLTSILIGCAQAVAIIPGVSRSGMTISAALYLGLSSKEAARFSFLLAIPIISGAGLLTALEVDGGFLLPFSISLAAIFSSFVVGVFALKWLLGWLEQGKFHYFGIYCFAVGIITLLI